VWFPLFLQNALLFSVIFSWCPFPMWSIEQVKSAEMNVKAKKNPPWQSLIWCRLASPPQLLILSFIEVLNRESNNRGLVSEMCFEFNWETGAAA
jgi:hypothetical protein